MVMYEDDDLVAIASEEVSLNKLFPGRSLETTEPAAGDVPHVATIDLADVSVREANERLLRATGRRARTSTSSTRTRATTSASA